jgi:hypothetical protein
MGLGAWLKSERQQSQNRGRNNIFENILKIAWQVALSDKKYPLI